MRASKIPVSDAVAVRSSPWGNCFRNSCPRGDQCAVPRTRRAMGSALRGVHVFVRYQITEHRIGDPLMVQK
jgi:hypothetical protein